MTTPFCTVWRACALSLALFAVPALAVESVPAERLDAFVAASDAVVVDVRSPEEYEAGHIAGAINVPHERIVAEPALLDAYRDRELVLYCQSGRRAGLVADALTRAGFERLHHLDGDMLGWRQRQLPLVQGAQPECTHC